MTALALARLSLLEIVRQRYALLPLLLTIGLVLAGALPAPTVVVNGGQALAAASDFVQLAGGLFALCGMGLGALIGAGLLANEIERGTVLLLVTKPLPRALVLLGKALGALGFLVACFALWGAVLALIVAMRGAPALAGQTFLAMFAGLLPASLMLSIAMAFSSRWPTGGALALTFCAWAFTGLASGLRSMSWEPVPVAVQVVREFSWLLPWVELLELPGKLAFGPAPELQAFLAMLAIPAWVLMAVGLFWRRDLS